MPITDINNPGVVEIADQGYPIAPDGGTPAPTNENVTIADQAEVPAPLDTVTSADPAPPLTPFLPANQGNPLGLPVNLTVPAENPVLLTDVQNVDTAIDGDPPVNPRSYLVSQVGSIPIDTAEALVNYTIGVLSALCNVKMTLASCTFAALTAGNLVITIFFSDGTNTVTTLTLGDLQALGAVSTGQISFLPSATKIIIGARMVVTALQGPGLLIPGTLATVQRVGFTDGELIDATQIAVSQTAIGGTSGVVPNVVVVTDDATGLSPTAGTVNLRLTFTMLRPFSANGVSLVGRPIAFQEIDANRPILVMADYYLVVSNADPIGPDIVPLGIEPGALISFDTARYAGEMIFQVDPFATQNVGPEPLGVPMDVIPTTGLVAETMNLKLDLVGCDFSALTAGDMIALVTLEGGAVYGQVFNLFALQALGNRRTAWVSLALQGVVPPFSLLDPRGIVVQAQLLIWSLSGPGLSAATASVQRNGKQVGEVIPTTTAVALPVSPYEVVNYFNQPLPPDPSTIGGSIINVNVADQIATIGTPLNVLP